MDNLDTHIKQQISFLEELTHVLEMELTLISSRDPESLLNLLKRKEELLDNIQKQDGIISTSFKDTDPSIRKSPEIEALFAQANELVSQCKYRTEINKTAVEQGQLRLEHLRNLLLESRAKESLTYDKSGKTQGSLLGKNINA
ncbi:MAG: flagella synthesis protein FlgN [Paraglaciecola sp.]|jgi:flagella synthesis protein FlgN